MREASTTTAERTLKTRVTNGDIGVPVTDRGLTRKHERNTKVSSLNLHVQTNYISTTNRT